MHSKSVLRPVVLASLLFATSAGADNGIETVLYSFDAPANSFYGTAPATSLVQGTDGNFYGTTSAEGGTIFQITPGGVLTSLYSLSFTVGDGPTALVQGSDGNFYGATGSGGTNGGGTVFKITPTGTLTTLYDFPASAGGGSPLVQGTDGNFYGTSPNAGTSGFGTVYKITPGGTLTTLYSFSGSDGKYPIGGLALGRDGSFYGTTASGGTNGSGVLFKVTPGGALTILHQFCTVTSKSICTDGTGFTGGLVQGSDGSFYGMTDIGGANNQGTVFKISLGGTFTTLYSFDNSGVVFTLAARLVQGKDGEFYGTVDGYPSYGTVFKITSSGTFTELYSFAGEPDGAFPHAGLVQGSDGNFYGTTEAGGTYGYGTVFRIAGITAPTGLTATGGVAQVTLNWAASFAASAGTTYNVYEGTAPGGESTTPVLTSVPNDSAVVTHLGNSKTYYFRVAAVNANGTSALSNEASSEPLHLPGPIVLLTAVPGNGQVTLHWSPSAGATDYIVFQGTASGREQIVATGVTTTNYIASKLTNGTTYYFGVAGVNSVGSGQNAKEVSATPQ